MVKRIFFGLLLMLSFTVFTFLAPTVASAYVCLPEEGAQTYYVNLDGSINPNGSFCVKASKLAIKPPEGCGYTRTGEAIECFEFRYDLISKKPGESLSGVNLLIPSKKQCDIALVSADRSVKIREYEPSTGFSATDLNTDVITWDALKLDASNKTNINVNTSLAGYGPSTMELKTGSGNQYVSIDGPVCCGITQTPTQATYFEPRTGATLTVEYSLCNYLPTSVTSNDGALEELLSGVAYCQQNSRTGELDPKLCYPIKKLGPRAGAVVYGKIDPPECPGDGEICDGFAYYGFGKKIYRISTEVPREIDLTCENIDLFSNVPRPQSVVIDDLVIFTPNACGNGNIEFIDADGNLTDGTSGPIYIVPYDASGDLVFSERSIVVSGSSEGAIFYANPTCAIIGGFYRCR